MAHQHYTAPDAAPRRKFNPLEQEWLTLAQALVWLACPDDPDRVRDAAPERIGLHRRKQPWEEWTPELDAALTRLLPPYPQKGPLEMLRIHARQDGKQVLWTDPTLIHIKQRAGNWRERLAFILTMDPPVMLDVADYVETFSELGRVPSPPPAERSPPPPARPPPPRPVKRPPPPFAKRSPPSLMKRLSQPPRESGAAAPLHRRAKASPMGATASLPESGKERHNTLISWFQDAHAAGAHNREKQDEAVRDRAERAGASRGWKECVDARRAANVSGTPGRKSGI
jgi:hypothetical protein